MPTVVAATCTALARRSCLLIGQNGFDRNLEKPACFVVHFCRGVLTSRVRFKEKKVSGALLKVKMLHGMCLVLSEPGELTRCPVVCRHRQLMYAVLVSAKAGLTFTAAPIAEPKPKDEANRLPL